jgi:hypothetical protein
VVGAVRPRARVEEHVRGLHVAVHETARMRGIECACDLRYDSDRVARIEAAAL